MLCGVCEDDTIAAAFIPSFGITLGVAACRIKDKRSVCASDGNSIHKLTQLTPGWSTVARVDVIANDSPSPGGTDSET